MLENEVKIYNLRAYYSNGDMFAERIFKTLKWAKEFKDKLIELANKDEVKIYVSIVPMINDEKCYQPYLRGLMQFEN